jgi:hypothetical protein
MSMSLIVIRPARCRSPSTSSSFSTLLPRRIARARSTVVSGGAVTRPSLVMTSLTRTSRLSTKRRSRRVRMPSTRSCSSTIGSPLIRCVAITSRASPTVASGRSVTGSMITPLALRLTFSTSPTCAFAGRFLWITPIPPCCASATASRHSVTVSIAALATGIFSSTPRQNSVEVSASRGRTSE